MTGKSKWVPTTCSTVCAFIMVCLAACCTLALFPKEAAPVEVEVPFPDMMRILQNGRLVVAITEKDYPPLFLKNRCGEMAGTDVQLIRAIATELGVDVVFNRAAKSFDDIIDVVSRGDADVGIGTSITLPRAKKVFFSEPYLVMNMALLVNRLQLIKEGIKGDLRNLAQIRMTKGPIGLMGGSAYRIYAGKMFPKAELIEYPSLQELREAVEKGEILAAVRNDVTEKLYFHNHPAAALYIQLFVDENSKDFVSIAVRPDCPHLLSWINTYLFIKEIRMNSHEVLEKFKRQEERCR